LAGALLRRGREALKKSAPGGGAGRSQISGALISCVTDITSIKSIRTSDCFATVTFSLLVRIRLARKYKLVSESFHLFQQFNYNILGGVFFNKPLGLNEADIEHQQQPR
jgi:hypothetical protein